MKTYTAKFNPEVNKGVFAISLVENPAMDGLFIALSEQKEIKLAEVDKEQRILMGLVLEPDKPIYRNQDGEEFNIVFDADTIKELSHGFFKFGNQSNSTIEHEPTQKIDGVTFVESWIVEDSKIDKSANFGFSYPKGSWIATMKVDSPDVWDNYVKTGKVQGFSIDAMVSLEEVNLKSNIKMSKEVENSLITFLKDLPSQIALALKPKEKEVKLGSVKTDDGTVTVEYDGEMLTLGGAVWMVAEDGTKVPLPVGSYTLETGVVIVVSEDGVVGEIQDTNAPAEPTPMSAEPAGAPNNDAQIAEEISTAIKSILIKYSEIETKLNAVLEKNTKLEADVLELSKQPASKGIKQPEVKVDLSKMTEFEKRKWHRENTN